MEPVDALQILAVEDDHDLAGLLKMLLNNKLAADVTIAEDCASARNILSASNFDLITLDYQLPDGNGLQLLEEITSQKDHPPVVMVTGKGDEKTAVDAFLAGAAGYVMKDTRLSIMLPAVIEKALDLKYASELLRVSEVRYRRLFEAAKDGILILDAETGQITDVNPFITNLLGYTSEEVLGKHLWEVGPFKDIPLSKELFSELQLKECIRYERLPLETKGGLRIDVEFVSNVYSADHTKVIQCNIRDIRVRKTAEEESQRVNAALEGFASTVSHDLRGPLANIGLASTTLMDLLAAPQTDKTRSEEIQVAEMLQKSSERSMNLVEKLLGLAEAGLNRPGFPGGSIF